MHASKSNKGKQKKRMFEPETNLTECEVEPNLHDFLVKRVKMEILDEDERNLKAVDRIDFEEPSNESDGIIMVHMDIREPLTSLRLILEEKLNRSLADYGFVLQDSQSLEGHKNLVDQCVQGEGLVQVNVAILSDSNGKRINIVDVLKPPEEYVEIGDKIDDDPEDNVDPDEDVMRFVVDPSFQIDQTKYHIPGDPLEWDESHVRHWLLWAVRQFNLTGIDLTDWEINGKELCELTLAEFQSKVPNDPDELFWTHYQLLKKCKIVAVNPSPKLPLKIKQEKIDDELSDSQLDEPHDEILSSPDTRSYSFHGSQSSSFSSHIKLWQFLLELLTDVRYREFIQWLDTEGEFKLINPEFVAQLWGVRKQKPYMNYEKLSRALRYYYDGNMLCKVNGKRFTYKFVCDLKQLIGYSASELNTLVLEAEEKVRKKNLSKNSDDAILIKNLFS